MTEKEWLASGKPEELLAALGRKASKRKRRLFGCACCRRIWPLLPDDRCREAVLTAEQFADDTIGGAELATAKVRAKAATDEQDEPTYTSRWAAGSAYCAALANAGDAAKAWHSATSAQQMRALAQRGITSSLDPRHSAFMTEVWNQELAAQANLLRDIFGNPFRPVALDPA